MPILPLLEFYTSYRGNVSAILRSEGVGAPMWA
jgi:hypothetical protein